MVVKSVLKVCCKSLFDILAGESAILLDIQIAEEPGQGLSLVFGQQLADDVGICYLFQFLWYFERLHVGKSILNVAFVQLVEVFFADVLAILRTAVPQVLSFEIIIEQILVEPSVIQAFFGRSSVFGVVL